MNTRVTVRQVEITRAIKAAKSAGMAVARCEIMPDGRIILSESHEETQDDAFGAWAAKRESRSKGAAQG